MGLYRSDISDDVFFKNYDTKPFILPENGYRYRVLIYKKEEVRPIAAAEMQFGHWKIIGDGTKEYRDLKQALKDAVNIYLLCEAEYSELAKA